MGSGGTKTIKKQTLEPPPPRITPTSKAQDWDPNLQAYVDRQAKSDNPELLDDPNADNEANKDNSLLG